MHSIADIAYLLLTSVFSVATVLLYFIHLLERRFSSLLWLIIPAITGLIVPTYCFLIYKNSELNFIVTIIFVFLTILFFKPIKSGLFYAATIEVIILLVDGIITCTFSILSLSISGPLAEISAYTLTAFIAYLFAKRFKYFHDIDMPLEYSYAFITVPVCSIGILYVVYNLFQESLITSSGTITIVIIVYILNIVSIFMYSKIVSYLELRAKNKALSSQIEAYVDKQNLYAGAFKELYTLQHNMKNELLPISTMLETGKYSLAQSKINNTLGSYNILQYITYTNITYIDDMINYKRFSAEKQAVQFLVQSNLNCQLNINYIDMSIMIGIALDNAIESSLESADKEVKICLYTKDNTFIVTISNSLSHKIVRDKNGVILSTKRDNVPHGIGLMSIKTLIDDNGGEQRISTEYGIFKITLILFEK